MILKQRMHRMAENQALQTTTQRLERLLEISRNLTSTLDSSLLLQMIIDVACELTQSETASILLHDSSTGELRFHATPDDQHATLSQISVPLDSSLAGWIFKNSRPMVIQDASTDPRIFRDVDRILDHQTRSILGVPLIVRDKPIGVLEVLNKNQQANYTEDDLAVLETLASQASIAIVNARMLTELKEANVELRMLDRMKSDFIAIASHELRTPLGLILGHATFLKEATKAEYEEQLEVIIRSSMRLKDIIEDMSTIAQKENGQSRVRRSSFSISLMVEDITHRFHEAAEKKNIELTCAVTFDNPLIVDGDREKIDVALSNLVQNAITFTDPGGQIGIKAEGATGYVKVFIIDSGIGIPEDEIERVFDRFYQVESHLTRKHGGMGLGLSIAKSMVEMHNGQIWCESKVGTGSLFCFMLPVDQERAAAAGKVFKSS
jgi:signal transduction histidine kinase